MLSNLYTFFTNLFSTVTKWIGAFFEKFFETLIDFLKLLFKPFLIIIAFIFYFLYELGSVIVLLFKFFLGIGKVMFSLITGIFKTIAGFSYTPSAPTGTGRWASIFENLSAHGLTFLQLDNLAYILMFGIWFGTAFLAIRILSNLRGGGAGAD